MTHITHIHSSNVHIYIYDTQESSKKKNKKKFLNYDFFLANHCKVLSTNHTYHHNIFILYIISNNILCNIYLNPSIRNNISIQLQTEKKFLNHMWILHHFK